MTASTSSSVLHNSCAQPSPCEPTPLAPHRCFLSGSYASTLVQVRVRVRGGDGDGDGEGEGEGEGEGG